MGPARRGHRREVAATLSLRAPQDHSAWLVVVVTAYINSFALLTIDKRTSPRASSCSSPGSHDRPGRTGTPSTGPNGRR
jgi:hypothetical protein